MLRLPSQQCWRFDRVLRFYRLNDNATLQSMCCVLPGLSTIIPEAGRSGRIKQEKRKSAQQDHRQSTPAQQSARFSLRYGLVIAVFSRVVHNACSCIRIRTKRTEPFFSKQSAMLSLAAQLWYDSDFQTSSSRMNRRQCSCMPYVHA